MILFFFQDLVGLWGQLANQGIAIAVLIVVGIFGLLFFIKALPVWERVKTAESEALKLQASSLGELASSQSQLATVVKDIAVEQRQSTEAVKILQRVNAKSNEQLAGEVQELNGTLQTFNERLDRLEKQNGQSISNSN